MPIRFALSVAALVALGIPAAAADWKPVETVSTYRVSGRSGAELYASIGENGPRAGMVRAIAHTSFKLTWQRDYRPQASGACTLVSARPKLTLIYTLPKASGTLPAPVQRSWDAFLEGIRAHERIHGDFIVDMVHEIVSFSVGLTVADDPSCQKIRRELTARLSEISLAQRARSRDFDRVELTGGGNVHRLVLDLVNGG